MQRTYIFYFLLLTLVNLPLYEIYKNDAKQSVAEYGSYSISDLGGSQNQYLISFID